MFNSSNPALKSLSRYADSTIEDRATYKGVALKALYFAVLVIASAISCAVLLISNPALAIVLLLISIPGALICGLIAGFVPSSTKVSGTLYAIFEGFLVGAISFLIGIQYAGIVFASLLATFTVFGVMMFLYASGIIKVTEKFRTIMFSALIAAVLFSLVVFVISLFSPAARELFYGSGPLSIFISIIMILIASFFILIDLDNISKIVAQGLPRKYEWPASFGLIITLIWLYIEFLKLFSKLKSRD